MSALTPERLAEIRERHRTLPKRGASPDVADLLAEVERFREMHERLMDSEWLAGYRAGRIDEQDGTRCGRRAAADALLNPTEGARDR